MKIGNIELPFRFVYVDAEGEITKRCLVSAKKAGIYIKGSQAGESVEKTYRIDRILQTIDSDYEWEKCPYLSPSYGNKAKHKEFSYSQGKSAGDGINNLFDFEKKMKAEQGNSKKEPTTKDAILGFVLLAIIIYAVYSFFGSDDDAKSEPVTPVKQENMVLSKDTVQPWPFTFSSLEIDCRYMPALVGKHENQYYALNGVAISGANKNNWKKLDADSDFWLNDPKNIGAKISVSDILKKGLASCEVKNNGSTHAYTIAPEGTLTSMQLINVKN